MSDCLPILYVKTPVNSLLFPVPNFMVLAKVNEKTLNQCGGASQPPPNDKNNAVVSCNACARALLLLNMAWWY